MDTSTINTPSFPGTRSERLLAGIILFFAAVLFGAASYPTFEGWFCWNTWKEDGPQAYFTYPDGRSRLADHADRPLHLLPSLTGWLLPGDFGTGVMLLGGLITLFRGILLIVLCQLGKINGPGAWLVFLTGLMEPIWPASGYERFHAAQVSFLGLIASVAFGLGFESTGKKWMALVGSLLLLASFMTYQGLFLAAMMAPLPFWVAGSKGKARALSLTLLPGCVVYLFYFFLISKLVPNTYVRGIVKDSLGPQSFIQVFSAGANCGYMAHLAFAAVAGASLAMWGQGKRPGQVGLVAVLFLGAPLAGLIYYSNLAYLGDPERLGFAATGWLTVMVLACFCCETKILARQARILVAFACILCLGVGCYHPYRTLRHVHLQDKVIKALASSGVEWRQESQVLLRDQTQILGGLPYTFLDYKLLNAARQALGYPGKVILCVDVAKEGHPGHNLNFCQDCKTSDFTDLVEIRRKKSWNPLGDHWVAQRVAR